MGVHQRIWPLVRAFHRLPILTLLEKPGGLKAMQSPQLGWNAWCRDDCWKGCLSWARLREDKIRLGEATAARCWPADNPRTGDVFLGRVPVARTVLAACQKESLGSDGSCWNGGIPKTQALHHVLVLGELCLWWGGGEDSTWGFRGLFYIVWLKLLSKLLNTWGRMPGGAAKENADGDHTVWPRWGNCTAQLCQQRLHRRTAGE